MIELPEAMVLSKQLANELSGKEIVEVVAAQNPHKFAWYSGDPALYDRLLTHKRIEGAVSNGGQVELWAGDMTLVFSDGVNLRFHLKNDPPPGKHQLLLKFNDETSLSTTIAMYGGLLCTPKGKNDNPYYLIAKDKPSPFSESFTLDYFLKLFTPEDLKLSLKAFLATNQRIPGLGNGVLQDILFNTGFHPRKKVDSLNDNDKNNLFVALINTLSKMMELGGRDSEKDIYGNPGGYTSILSKNTLSRPCSRCGSQIMKEAYLGGSIYFCSGCQSV
ncbi:MAG: endonuclease VIII [Chloroflexi bacterium HGW-Chloroflexi-3]|nr:MAG: endonuclease VIII [Chloroflexi bacterium HGW-Chloroflexi-3]